MMMTLKDYLKKSADEKWALPHFNISDAATLRGICEAAKETRSPVLIGVSENERNFIGLNQALSLIKIFREEYAVPLFLNADHSHSVNSAKSAIDAGYDSVHIDLSKLPYEENLKGTKEVVEYAKSKNPNISVEGELGYLVTDSSEIYKETIEIPRESLTKPEQAEEFAKETGIDRFAPAVGNLHGIAANEPDLDIKRIENIRKILPKEISIVLHGGSGVSDEQAREAIAAGINNIHINTEIRAVYVNALYKFLTENPDEIAPYKLFKPVIEAVKEKIKEKIKLFGSANKI